MKEDIIRMAREAGMPYYWRTGEITYIDKLERFASLVAAAERNKVAQWMIDHSFATGHGDTVEDLLKELEWQVREACAKVAEAYEPRCDTCPSGVAAAIRARGQDPMPLFNDWPGGWKK